MRIVCDVEEIELESEETGQDIDSVCVTCSRCDYSTESYGTSEASVKRCLVLLREGCPKGENNFYVADE